MGYFEVLKSTINMLNDTKYVKFETFAFSD